MGYGRMCFPGPMPSFDSAAVDGLAVERRRQGLPNYVEGPVILTRVVVLILAGPAELPAPDDLDPGRVEGGSGAGRRPRDRWAAAGLWVHSRVVYPSSRWGKDPAAFLQRPVGDRAGELQDAQRAEWAASFEPREHE
jgi:hypothetical protein